MARMANPIYNTTDGQSGRITIEHHSPGDLTGSIDTPHAGETAEYIEILKTPEAEKYKHSVPEFPSKSAGVGTNDN